jgi:hypothetical protein
MMPDQDGGLTPNGVIDGTAHDGAEIDIFEGVQNSDKYWTGLHYDGYGDSHQNVGKEITAPGLHSEEYHIFGFEWAPSFLKYYYDGKVVRTVTDPKLIPEVPHFLYLSGAIWSEIGWSEMSVLDNAFLNSGGVDKAYFDYVRVFKNRTTYPNGNELPGGFTENTIVMDNADALGVTITGEWSISTASDPFYKSNYLHDNNQSKGSKSVSFSPALNQAGKYEVYAYSPSETNRSTATKYIIKRAEGDTTVLVDQTKNGGVWLSLGKYNLLSDNSPKVIISNANTSGYVIADAVAFVPIMNTAIHDLMEAKDAVSVFSDNKEIIVRFNEHPFGLVRIEIYNANGILIDTRIITDLNRKCQTFRLKNNSYGTTAMYFVKVSIDGKYVCKKVIS